MSRSATSSTSCLVIYATDSAASPDDENDTTKDNSSSRRRKTTYQKATSSLSPRAKTRRSRSIRWFHLSIFAAEVVLRLTGDEEAASNVAAVVISTEQDNVNEAAAQVFSSLIYCGKNRRVAAAMAVAVLNQGNLMSAQGDTFVGKKNRAEGSDKEEEFTSENDTSLGAIPSSADLEEPISPSPGTMKKRKTKKRENKGKSKEGNMRRSVDFNANNVNLHTKSDFEGQQNHIAIQPKHRVIVVAQNSEDKQDTETADNDDHDENEIHEMMRVIPEASVVISTEEDNPSEVAAQVFSSLIDGGKSRQSAAAAAVAVLKAGILQSLEDENGVTVAKYDCEGEESSSKEEISTDKKYIQQNAVSISRPVSWNSNTLDTVSSGGVKQVSFTAECESSHDTRGSQEPHPLSEKSVSQQTFDSDNNEIISTPKPAKLPSSKFSHWKANSSDSVTSRNTMPLEQTKSLKFMKSSSSFKSDDNISVGAKSCTNTVVTHKTAPLPSSKFSRWKTNGSTAVPLESNCADTGNTHKTAPLPYSKFSMWKAGGGSSVVSNSSIPLAQKVSPEFMDSSPSSTSNDKSHDIENNTRKNFPLPPVKSERGSPVSSRGTMPREQSPKSTETASVRYDRRHERETGVNTSNARQIAPLSSSRISRWTPQGGTSVASNPGLPLVEHKLLPLRRFMESSSSILDKKIENDNANCGDTINTINTTPLPSSNLPRWKARAVPSGASSAIMSLPQKKSLPLHEFMESSSSIQYKVKIEESESCGDTVITRRTARLPSSKASPWKSTTKASNSATALAQKTSLPQHKFTESSSAFLNRSKINKEDNCGDTVDTRKTAPLPAFNSSRLSSNDSGSSCATMPLPKKSLDSFMELFSPTVDSTTNNEKKKQGVTNNAPLSKIPTDIATKNSVMEASLNSRASCATSTTRKQDNTQPWNMFMESSSLDNSINNERGSFSATRNTPQTGITQKMYPLYPDSCGASRKTMPAAPLQGILRTKMPFQTQRRNLRSPPPTQQRLPSPPPPLAYSSSSSSNSTESSVHPSTSSALSSNPNLMPDDAGDSMDAEVSDTMYYPEDLDNLYPSPHDEISMLLSDTTSLYCSDVSVEAKVIDTLYHPSDSDPSTSSTNNNNARNPETDTYPRTTTRIYCGSDSVEAKVFDEIRDGGSNISNATNFPNNENQYPIPEAKPINWYHVSVSVAATVLHLTGGDEKAAHDVALAVMSIEDGNLTEAATKVFSSLIYGGKSRRVAAAAAICVLKEGNVLSPEEDNVDDEQEREEQELISGLWLGKENDTQGHPSPPYPDSAEKRTAHKSSEETELEETCVSSRMNSKTTDTPSEEHQPLTSKQPSRLIIVIMNKDEKHHQKVRNEKEIYETVRNILDHQQERDYVTSDDDNCSVALNRYSTRFTHTAAFPGKKKKSMGKKMREYLFRRSQNSSIFI